MIYLLLSILFTSSLILFFKLFEKYKINTFQALVFNYITAAVIGLLASNSSPTFYLHQPWLPLSLSLGILFITIFYAVSLTTVHISVSAATVSNKMSVVIPVIAAIYLYNDTITVLKIGGIILALAAVYMTSKRKNNQISQLTGKQLFILPLIVFIGSGIIDVMVNFAQVNYLQSQSNGPFLAVAFGTAFIVGSVILIVQLITKNSKVEMKNIIGGVCLGVPNYLSIHTLIKALDSKLVESSVLYPINNMGVVTVSAVAAYFLFKEKLSLLNLTGIIFALIAIVLISLKLN